MRDRVFLNWVADRFVNRHGESENVDFVRKLRRIADTLPPDQDTPFIIGGGEIVAIATEAGDHELADLLRRFTSNRTEALGPIEALVAEDIPEDQAQ